MTVMMVVTMMAASQLLHGCKGGGLQWLALMVLMMMLHLCSLTWQLALRFAAHAHGRLTDYRMIGRFDRPRLTRPLLTSHYGLLRTTIVPRLW